MTKRQGQEDLSRRARPASAHPGGEPGSQRLRSPCAKLGAKTQDARSRCPAPVGPVTPTQGRLEARRGTDRCPGSSSSPREEELPVEPPGSERGWRVEPDPHGRQSWALEEESPKGEEESAAPSKTLAGGKAGRAGSRVPGLLGALRTDRGAAGRPRRPKGKEGEVPVEGRGIGS